MRKRTLSKTLVTNPASYLYFETLTKTFQTSTGPHKYKGEVVFARELIRRLALCLNANEAFVGKNRQNAFHFQNFEPETIYIYRNGMPVADSPISKTDDKPLYFSKKSYLGYIDNGHGISLTNYQNHFKMAFHWTSTQQAFHYFLHRELANCSISVELNLSAALHNNIHTINIGVKAQSLWILRAGYQNITL